MSKSFYYSYLYIVFFFLLILPHTGIFEACMALMKTKFTSFVEGKSHALLASPTMALHPVPPTQ